MHGGFLRTTGFCLHLTLRPLFHLPTSPRPREGQQPQKDRPRLLEAAQRLLRHSHEAGDGQEGECAVGIPTETGLGLWVRVPL